MKLISIFLFILTCNTAFAQKNKAIFLVHSTGGNLYNQGKVSDWVKTYNSANGTDFQITTRSFPNTPWPWENYSYDYWKLWVNNSCDNTDLDIECLPSIASNYGLVIFKHCYPGAGIGTDTGKPDVTSKIKSLENYKLQYRALRTLMDGMPDKKFMIWTLVPLHRLATSTEAAARANEFVKWVKNEWLIEDGKLHTNISIFDFFSLAAEMNENPTTGKQYCLKYDYEGSHTSSDSHPNTLANTTIGPLFAQAVVKVLSTNLITNITISTQIGTTSITTNNGTLQLSAYILPDDATTKTVTWSVVDLTGKASISASGLVTSQKDGTVKVIATATDGSSVKGEFTITISNQVIPVESISLSSPDETTITTDNGTIQLLAALLPADATTKSVTWTVTNITGKATINSSGLLTAEKDGTVKAIATATDGSGIKGVLLITISNQLIPVESISLSSPDGTSITTENGTLHLLPDIQPIDATNTSIKWDIANLTGKASINAEGIIIAEKNGKIKVTATATDGSDISGELTITISNQIVPVEQVTINDNLENDTIKGLDTKIDLNVFVTPSDATNPNVEWIIENITGKASIDDNGSLTTIFPGTIRVIAQAKDESKCISQKEYTIVIPVSLPDEINQTGFKVFPNPTSGRIQIQIDQISKDGACIEIMNSNGQILMKKTVFENRSECKLNEYASSLFFITITNNKKVFTQKIIKELISK